MLASRPIKKIKLSADDPCPCGSGKSIALCHLDPIDGRFRKAVPRLRPPGKRTDYAHPGCYFRTTQNCSKQISREHYISRSVLERVGQIVRLSGAHWLDEGHTLETSVGNLTAKILCRRHNESLSPLDSEAGIFFGALADAFKDLKRKTLSRKPIFHLASGEALELWMLKVACGHYFGIGTINGVRLDETHAINLFKVEEAFYHRKWDARSGLYFKGGVGTRVETRNYVSVTSLTDEERNQMAGVRAGLLGLELDLLFDSDNTYPGPWTGLAKRPSEFVIRRGPRRHSIILTWPVGTPERSVTLDQRPPTSVERR